MTTVPVSELPVYTRLPVEVIDGHEAQLTTADGDTLLDFYGGHATASLGYGHPRLTTAIRQQAERLLFQSNIVDVEIRRRATVKLAAFAPDPLTQVFFVNSGAEANENALRMAFRVTGRSKVVALEGGFHGRTAAAGACTHGSSRWYAFPRAPFDVTFVPRDDVEALASAIDSDTAAVILEPIQGIAGAVPLDAAFLQKVRELTTKHGALFIADEIQCGVGRSGDAFAFEYGAVTPDILTTAKGLGGGVPVGAVICTDEVAKPFGIGDLGTTFGGGPLVMAAVEAVVETIERDDLLSRVKRMEQCIRDTCAVGPVLEIQGRGLLLGLRTSLPSSDLLPKLLKRGILAGGASDPHVVRLMPPLTIRRTDVQRLEEALKGIGG